MHLDVSDLQEPEVMQAYRMLQGDSNLTPEKIIQKLRPGAELLDPESFISRIQQQYQKVMQLKRGSGNGAEE